MDSLPPDIPPDRIPPPVQDVSPTLHGRDRRTKVSKTGTVKLNPRTVVKKHVGAEVMAGILWKVAAKAASTLRPFSPDSPHAFVHIRESMEKGFTSVAKRVDRKHYQCRDDDLLS
ncbi:hypothetical protein L2E82_25841 [Cichorium intybus]|uniref:Uncharacterized protein n=1 Tax=Cichorium intybus TaxID=13427 RepID=A0ACB9E4B0_CICIN|nr:hypothetical protein L2E82_25841 [Cichorium intybus]